MNTESPSRRSQQEKDGEEEEMEKYAVSCRCPEGKRPKNAEMTKLAEGFKCPSCGRLHPLEE